CRRSTGRFAPWPGASRASRALRSCARTTAASSPPRFCRRRPGP
ncbi:MAG: hypothetical protein AVDCRST_MAG73-2609, partial [uncultured Thermomicrobiales bacterium]